MDIGYCKSSHGKERELLNQNFLTQDVIYKAYFKNILVQNTTEHLIYLSIGQIINKRTWKIPILLSFVHRFI
jgi:hypothetical protein